MVDFRKVKLGEVLDIKANEFDGECEDHGVVTEICDDHAIVTDIRDTMFHGVLKNVTYWLDDDTAELFYTSELENYDWGANQG